MKDRHPDERPGTLMKDRHPDERVTLMKDRHLDERPGTTLKPLLDISMQMSEPVTKDHVLNV